MLSDTKIRISFSLFQMKSLFLLIVAGVMFNAWFSTPLIAQDSLNISKIGTLYDFWSETSDAYVMGNYILAKNHPHNRLLHLENNQLVEIDVPTNTPFPEYVFQDTLGISGNSIYDFANPLSPQLLGEMDIELSTWHFSMPRFCVHGEYLYCFSWDYNEMEHPEIDIFDLRDIENPALRTTYVIESTTYFQHYTFGSNFFIFNYEFLYDLTTPDQPVFVGTIDDVDQRGAAQIPIAYDNYVYWRSRTRDNDCMVVADLSNLQNIQIVREISPPPVQWYDYGSYLKFFGNGIAWVGNTVVDFSNPLSPTLLGFIELSFKRSYSDEFVVSFDESINLYCAENNVEPELLASFNNHDEMKDMALVGKHAVLSCKTGIRIVDIQNPYQPEEVAHLEMRNLSYGKMTIAGSIAYVGYYDSIDRLHKIAMFDLSSISNPRFIGYISDPEFTHNGLRVRRLLFKDNYLFGCEPFDWKVFSVDISDPFQPGETNDLEDFKWDIAIKDNYLYSILNTGEPVIYSIVSPDQPEFIGIIDTTYDIWYRELEIDTDRLYGLLYHSIGGFNIFDITDPSNPAQLGMLEDEEYYFYNGWKVEDHHIVGQTSRSFTVLDVDDVHNPNISGIYPIESYYVDTEFRGEYAFLLEHYSLKILEVSEAMGVESGDVIQPLPLSFNVHSPYPNPFNSTVTIPFTLNQPSTVSFTVRNILGQLVLEDKRYEQAGENQFHLSLPEMQGASSGMYTIEVEAGGFQHTRRAVFVK